MRVRDIDFSNCYQTKKSLIYDISYKNFVGVQLVRIRFDEIDDFIKVYMIALNIQYYLLPKDIMKFMIGLDIL